VAHICHAPLATTGVFKGKRTAVYPALAPDIKAAGTDFVNSEVVIDGTVVSARAWLDHPSWMREFVRLVKQKGPVQEQEVAAAR